MNIPRESTQPEALKMTSLFLPALCTSAMPQETQSGLLKTNEKGEQSSYCCHSNLCQLTSVSASPDMKQIQSSCLDNPELVI